MGAVAHAVRAAPGQEDVQILLELIDEIQTQQRVDRFGQQLRIARLLGQGADLFSVEEEDRGQPRRHEFTQESFAFVARQRVEQFAVFPDVQIVHQPAVVGRPLAAHPVGQLLAQARKVETQFHRGMDGLRRRRAVAGSAVMNVSRQIGFVFLLADTAAQRHGAMQTEPHAFDEGRLAHAVLAAEEHKRPIELTGGVGRQVEGVDPAVDAKVLEGDGAQQHG